MFKNYFRFSDIFIDVSDTNPMFFNSYIIITDCRLQTMASSPQFVTFASLLMTVEYLLHEHEKFPIHKDRMLCAV